MKLETTRKRGWAVLAGVWVVLSLALATPFSEIMLGDAEVAQIIFSFSFLSLSPFIPVIHDWVAPGSKYRWVHAIVVTLLSGFLFIVAESAWGDEEVAMTIVGLWWAIYAAAYWLTGELTSKGLTLPNMFRNLSWLWGILSAILVLLVCMVSGALFDPEVGPIIGQLLGLTIWVFGWYRIRRGKPQLYRWRNFLFVLVVANWAGVAASLASPAGIFVGPVVGLLGILFFVVPTPKERVRA